MPFLEDLKSAWDRLPSVRLCVAALAGVKPKPKPSRDYTSLVSMFPSGALK